jgi:hypothetical protein
MSEEKNAQTGAGQHAALTGSPMPPPPPPQGYYGPAFGNGPHGASDTYSHGMQQPYPVRSPMPQAGVVATNLGLAITAAILAFPLGLVAVYFANQAQKALTVGDLETARRHGSNAKIWAIVLIVLVVIGWIVLLSAPDSGSTY